MKPADHPDFFRFPAPEGRSRESAIRLDAEGRFWDHGSLIENPAMQRAFLRWIARHPDDGRPILTNGYDWTYFTVDDTPFRVVRCARSGDGLRIGLDDESEELLRGPVWLGGQGALYTRVKDGQFEARFRRDVQAGLGDAVVAQADGGFGLDDGVRVIAVLPRRPEPLSPPKKSRSSGP